MDWHVLRRFLVDCPTRRLLRPISFLSFCLSPPPPTRLSDDLMQTMDADRHHRSYRLPSGKSALSEGPSRERRRRKKKYPTNQKPHNKNGNKTSRCKSSTGITLDDKRLPALCSVCVEGRIPLCLIGSLPSREGWGGSLFFLLLPFFILLLLLYIYITNLEPNKLRLSLSSLSPFEFECAILWVIWGGTEKPKKKSFV